MIRFMNTPFLALVVALLPIDAALGADSPIYKDRLLTIPSINTDEQVGKYQDVMFTLTEQGVWQLLSGKAIGGYVAIGASGIGLPQIEKVDVFKTDTFPVQVFLRVSGGFFPCPNSTLGQINQRLENNRFDIMLTTNYIRPAPEPVPPLCTANFVMFARTISLPVYGLSAGIYSYGVNANSAFGGATGTFELTADNKLPGDY